MLTIAFQESFKVGNEQIDEIIEASQHDVRQSIYSLQLLSSGGKGSEVQRKDAAIVSCLVASTLTPLGSHVPQRFKSQGHIKIG